MAYQSQWKERSGEILAIAAQVREQHPDYWEALKIHGTQDRRFINETSVRCIKSGIPAGVNQKRGTQGDSIDALALPNPTGVAAAVGPYPFVEIIDIVGGAEGGPGSTPTLVWGDVTQATIDKGEKGGWKAGVVNGEQPVPIPPVPPAQPVQPYPSEPDWWRQVFDVEVAKRYALKGRPYPDGPDSLTWSTRTAYMIRDGMTKEAALEKYLKELEQALGL